MNTKHVSYFASRLLLLVGGLLVMNSATAAPGLLADQPLQTSASAPPNLMFMIDTSGSMNNVVPDSPYDPTVDYTPADCDTVTLPMTTTTSRIDMQIVGGVPKYDIDGTDYDLTDQCFDRTRTYNARLNANDVTDANNKVASGYLQAEYTGNYLNWYFYDTTDNNITWTIQAMKPADGVDTRMNIAKTAATGLIDGLANIRVGLARFNSGDGAYIEQNVKTLTPTHKTAITTTINGLSGSGNTPVSETLLDIGRYFVGNGGTNNPGGITTTVNPPESNGQYNGNLTLHPDATTPVVDDDDDVFGHSPAFRPGLTAASPIQYWCQQNFAILMTDGRPQGDEGLATLTYTVEAVRDYDGDCSTCDHSDNNTDYDQKAGQTGPNGGTYEYESSGSDYMDDVAALLYDIDLRPDIDDNNNNEVKNNLITYTIGFADDQVINDPLMYDTAVNGGGEFITAGNAADLADAFSRATSSIISRSSTSSAVTFNSSTLSSQTAVYQALFNTVRWSGELKSVPLNGFTGALLNNCTLGNDNCWTASTQLDAQMASNSGNGHVNRLVLTYNPDDTTTPANKAGVAFKAPANYKSLGNTTVPQALIDDLCGTGRPFDCTTTTASEITANQNYINNLVNYLRGDRFHETSGTTYNFRTRTNVLGDIVNASPVFVGKPASNWPNRPPFPETASPDPSYSAFASANTNRTPIVYTAANDGMLHGFRATESSANAGDAGYEVFAYIPTGTFSAAANEGLHYLADPAYTHKFYNDLPPTVADVYMNHKQADGSTTGTTASTREWRTVLLGGQRGGGASLYLLDVTNPGDFSEANAKALVEWEFTHPDLGYTFSKPTIAMMNNGKFAAIFGNGYSEETAGSCTAKLFVVFLEGGLDGEWTAGSDYLIFDTGSGSTTDGDCNGLSTPAVLDLDKDRDVDRVYAGDLKGNLWAFDLCNLSNGSNAACQASGWALAEATPLMIANDGTNRQPITTQPVVSLDPASTGAADLLIVVGTGQYLTDGDKSTNTLQTVYGVRDYDALSNTHNTNQSWALDPRSDPFIEQTLTEGNCTATGCSGLIRTITNVAIGDFSTHKGWFIDLDAAGAGERVIVNPKIRNDTLFFNTLIPDATVCSAGGSGWLMSVNLENGGVPLREVFDINGDGIIDVNDRENDEPPVGEKVDEGTGESTFLGDLQYTPDFEGEINVRKVKFGKSQREGRMSWREMLVE